MKLHPIAEKIAPIIAAVLLMLSHSKNVNGHIKTMGFQGVVSVWSK